MGREGDEPRKMGPAGWRPAGWGPAGWDPAGWGPEGWRPEGWGEGWGARRVGGPKFRAFFFHSGHNFLSFFPLRGPLVEFWWCLKRRDPLMCTFGVLGLSCLRRRPAEAGGLEAERGSVEGGPAEGGSGGGNQKKEKKTQKSFIVQKSKKNLQKNTKIKNEKKTMKK